MREDIDFHQEGVLSPDLEGSKPENTTLLNSESGELPEHPGHLWGGRVANMSCHLIHATVILSTYLSTGCAALLMKSLRFVRLYQTSTLQSLGSQTAWQDLGHWTTMLHCSAGLSDACAELHFSASSPLLSCHGELALSLPSNQVNSRTFGLGLFCPG